MSTDDFGNLIYPGHDYGNPKYPGSIDNGAIDVEHSPIFYTTKTERIICAQDERFASVNEAIGTLQYNLEQHIEKCADGLAPLADFISSSWAVIDELETRIAQLEAAQPKPTISRWPAADHPPEGDWAHIPSAEWEAIVEELEGLRNQRAVMDADGVLLSHDAWDAMERELAELRAKWDAIPWSTLNHCELILTSYNRLIESVDTRNRADEMREWLDANMPKEAGEC